MVYNRTPMQACRAYPNVFHGRSWSPGSVPSILFGDAIQVSLTLLFLLLPALYFNAY